MIPPLALLAGPGAPSLPPSNCAKFAGAGVFPLLRRCAAPWLGYAQPEAQNKSSAFGGRWRLAVVQDAPHSKFRKKLHVAIPCVLDWADFSVVAPTSAAPLPGMGHCRLLTPHRTHVARGPMTQTANRQASSVLAQRTPARSTCGGRSSGTDMNRVAAARTTGCCRKSAPGSH
jgi:hypothetical protein